MVREAQRPTISPAELFEVAEAVARSGEQQTVELHGKTLAIVPRESSRQATDTPRRRKPRENAFLAAYGSVPPLNPPRTINEMTEIAAEEAALEAARAGLPSDAGS